MKVARNASGYILVLALIVVSLAVVLVSFVASRVTIYIPVTQTTVERQKALMLAYGGVQLAMSQLAYADVAQEEPTEQKEEAAAQKKPGNVGVVTFLSTLLPHLNEWQTVKLSVANEGLNGEIKLCIVAEEGKININELYDFKKHAFISLKKAVPSAVPPADPKKQAQPKPAPIKEAEENETEKIVQIIFEHVQKTQGGENLFDAFATFLKNRQDKLHDVSELLKIKEFAVFKNALYYEPFKVSEKTPARIFLTDLFTIWSGKKSIDPWCLSSSTSQACGFEINAEKSADAQSQQKENIKQFTGAYNWPQDWDKYFKNRYNKDLPALPAGFQSMLATRFEPTVFAVLSSGTVGRITERVYALVERNRPPSGSKQPARVTVKKMYRI